MFFEDNMFFEENVVFKDELREKIKVIHGFLVSWCKVPTPVHKGEAVNLACCVVSNSL